MASSRNTVGSPKALSASRRALSTAPVTPGRTVHPPQAPASTAGGGLHEDGVADFVGAGQSRGGVDDRWRLAQHRKFLLPSAAPRARILLPASSSTSALGPTKVTPADWQASAKSGLSDRNP